MQPINLKEKTLDELKVIGWDLRTVIDQNNRMLQALLQEIASRERENPPKPEP